MEQTPKSDLVEEIELQLTPRVREGTPEPETPSLRPVEDVGGPTTQYHGDIGDIGEVVVAFENMIHGRDAYTGMEGIPEADRIIRP